MGFILDGLDSESYDRQYGDRELLNRIAGYFRPYGKQMLLVAAMIALNSLAGVGGPILISASLDLLSKESSTQMIILLTAGVMLMGSAAWLFNFIRQWFSARVTGNVVLQLRKDSFDATVQHDLSFFDEHPSGKIVSRITSDTQDFAETVNLTLNLMSQILLVIILSIWLLSISVTLTFVMLAFTPIAAAIALSFRKVARRVTQRARRVTAKINAQIQESISGIVVAKSFRQESAVYRTFDANNRQGYQVGWRRGVTLVSIFPIMGMASGLGMGILVFFGGLATRGPEGISTGDWYLFMQASGFVWFPMMSIASFWSQFQDGLSASERVFALIDRDPKVIQDADEAVPEMMGHIEFRDLMLTYTGTEIVLPDFSLDIRAGETVALVGHTGAGKSSVARLITRFYEFQGGQLLVDGRDIRRLNLSEYRQHIGLVPQEPFLFTGTVRDNIRYSRPGASDADV
ncbi:MAG: ABC transporter ATP-binding protein, partial [Chloroflexota bacterium]